ncbi:F-box protein At5g07610-like [Rhododendron vialii]|uniref:F-box protein At5g07610-like n=1 Tax=Rhododendron vialii TaxID=182163 RepID=UPI00265F8741|nr:F-box protein At5g07610-like [Rhododendron vialii]
MRKRRKAILNILPSEISPTAESIANNVDLLTEILLRVPAGSIMRFKCVSKHWLFLLSDSQFATNHSIRNPRPSISGLYFYIKETLKSVSLHGRRNLPPLPFFDGLGEPSKIRVTHSCNGLLLCYNSHFDGYRHRRQYVVCNLTTKKYTILPKYEGSVHGLDACLAFDPSKSPHHYKVVLVRDNRCQMDVYSSQSLSWKIVPVRQTSCGRGVFWNGAIHWLTDDNLLLKFDVDVEEMTAMPNPQSPKILPLDKKRYFGQCGDGLILIQCRSRHPSGFRILELEKDYSGWSVKCRVNLRPLISEFPEMTRRIYSNKFKVLCVVKGENERDFALVLAIPGRIVSYYVKHKTWDVLRDLAPGESIEYGLNGYFAVDDYVYPFIENLFPC